MGDYGAAVSQRGYDVKSCADRFLLYSSAFQTLKVFMKVKVTGTLPLTIYHNLNYFCPFEVIAHNAPVFAYENWKSIPFSDGFFYNSVNARCYTDRIVIVNGEYDPEESNSYTVIIYLDNFSTVNERTIGTGVTEGSFSGDYGFRISKAGYDVKTCLDEECAFTSKASFSEIIHKKGINTQRSGQVYVTQNTGAALKYLAFQKKTTDSFITPMVRRGRTTLSLDGAWADTGGLHMGIDNGSGGFLTGYDFYYLMYKNRFEVV